MRRTGKRPFILPYEPEYTAHRTSQRQVRNARMRGRVHINALQSPSIAPDDWFGPDMAEPRLLPAR
jgi:hypothetical protein